MPKIALLTVVYNNYTVLEDFFSSLEKQTYSDFHVFIADSSSKKETISRDKIPLTVIPSNNLGYSHGINIALEKAIKEGYTRFCVINNDVYFEKDFLNIMSKSLDEYPSSLLGGKIYYAQGFEYHKDRYAKNELGKVIWYAGGTVDWNHALTFHKGVDEVDKGHYDITFKTEFITGCLMCFDKNVVDAIGNWDETYFLYYEDADYCERAKKAGLSLMYIPSLQLWHKNAQSTEGSGSKLHEYYQEKSRVRFALKYAPLRTKFHVLKNYLLRTLHSFQSTP